MNLQQLEYLLAVNKYRHFARAAEHCHVTQPTLSMMIKKLEEELNVLIFDRSIQPVEPTNIGRKLIEQAQTVLSEAAGMKDLVREEQVTVSGPLKIGVIPTLAPYLIPSFLPRFLHTHPGLQLKISEHTTEDLIKQLKVRHIDIGILVTPLNDRSVREIPLFYESFLVYTSDPSEKAYIIPEEIDPNDLWLLEEGHCFRSQVVNLCELKDQRQVAMQYQAGSFETLKRLVEEEKGITILPELATLHLNGRQKKLLKPFAPPQPVREVSLVIRKNFVRQRLVEILSTAILDNLPAQIQRENPGQRVDIY
ncbi:hydrogen peroxide-inducible genes activator [Flavilitoribacter nigricans]|uniref:DNA-binding transcriptional regulator OxyR n=1 Tax=Flavilitoribacter nigricans (strain ATCC 23147 / DSM 23189 / NBRC 102662 / NCIMB 1420 / SS-2) TaxID=1122177 RepID=A0A2D0NAY4_FLAN2|nr:hydrogen peroxide-inducible genes activator [Flavilitoribacter nigricans]PHN05329.1 DNA-binding transcriptional regulator OxyR [Flavilitoribacter nigricans DSM 23189 = NBRC 102662]